MNPVLERLYRERQEQISYIDHLLARVEDEGRDLVEAEQAALDAARQRIEELDAQIEPLEAYERRRAAHEDTAGRLPGPDSRDRPDHNGGQPRRIDGTDRAPGYASAGAFVVDVIRAGGFMERMGGTPDPAAQTRVAQSRAVANQTTADTPGLLPAPIVGAVVNLIDANRPLITSVGGARPLGGIPGLGFSRPKITRRTAVGKQSAEKTELASQAMKIEPVAFTKETYGGTVDVSRQDVDWTSPTSWDILIRDLADQYAIQTETAAAAAFAAAAGGNDAVAVASDDLKGWATALYGAAEASYRVNKKLPDRIWASLDVWALLGPVVDVAHLINPPAVNGNNLGNSELASFAGNLFNVPRIVVPELPAGTCVVGSAALFEVYEEVIGLLSVIEPSILGVTVAYGGYVAYGAVEAGGFIPVTAPGGEVEAAASRASAGGGSGGRTTVGGK